MLLFSLTAALSRDSRPSPGFSGSFFERGLGGWGNPGETGEWVSRNAEMASGNSRLKVSVGATNCA